MEEIMEMDRGLIGLILGQFKSRTGSSTGRRNQPFRKFKRLQKGWEFRSS